MPSELDLVAFSRQVAEVMRENAHRWTVTQVPDSLRAYVIMTPVGTDDTYCIRIDFGESLAAGPASVVFCEPETHAEGSLSAWPKGLTQYFKTPPNNGPTGWICNPWTREGRQHHAEWHSRGWTAARALWCTITAVQDILDAPGAYTGRAA